MDGCYHGLGDLGIDQAASLPSSTRSARLTTYDQHTPFTGQALTGDSPTGSCRTHKPET